MVSVGYIGIDRFYSTHQGPCNSLDHEDVEVSHMLPHHMVPEAQLTPRACKRFIVKTL